jgi:mono/diheme cytochrome c family protein
MKAMILGASALLVAASAMAYGPEDLKAIGQGRGLYLKNCAACHGADARGAGPRAAEGRPAVPDLTAMASREGGFKTLHVQAQIRYSAGSGMPSWGRGLASPGYVRGEAAAAKDIWLLSRYLEYAQTSGVTVAGKPEADQPAPGKPQGR